MMRSNAVVVVIGALMAAACHEGPPQVEPPADATENRAAKAAVSLDQLRDELKLAPAQIDAIEFIGPDRDRIRLTLLFPEYPNVKFHRGMSTRLYASQKDKGDARGFVDRTIRSTLDATRTMIDAAMKTDGSGQAAVDRVEQEHRAFSGLE